MTKTEMDRIPSPYAVLPMKGPYDVAIGTALIALIEPDEGHDREFNRWYEDEHMPAAMALPWKWAGRRWVAPRDLQELRYPRDSALAQPVSAGKYLSAFWLTPGRYEDHAEWSVAKNGRDRAEGRWFSESSLVYMTFANYAGVVYRDTEGPRDIHALDYPYEGLVLEVLDPTGARDELLQWLREEYVPGRLAGSPIAMTLLFEPNPLRAAQEAEGGKSVDQFVAMLSFTEVRPPDGWDPAFAGAGDAIKARGLGRVVLAAPFWPTLAGTDVYVDELR